MPGDRRLFSSKSSHTKEAEKSSTHGPIGPNHDLNKTKNLENDPSNVPISKQLVDSISVLPKKKFQIAISESNPSLALRKAQIIVEKAQEQILPDQ